MSMANVAGVVAGAGAGRTLKKATGTPYGDDERVRKMMATRPGLNANRRRAPKQDLSGATPQGTIVGRGGRTQQLGKAAMSRLPPPAAAPPTAASMSVPEGLAVNMSAPQDEFTTAMAGGGPPPGAEGAAPGVVNPLEQAMGRQAQAMGGGQGGYLTPEQTAASMSRPPGGGQVPPEMAGAVQTALAGAKGGGGFSPGLPPAIMQRLQALRGGGLQGGAGAGAGGAPNPRSFADFWQGGNAPVRAF